MAEYIDVVNSRKNVSLSRDILKQGWALSMTSTLWSDLWDDFHN